MSAISAEPITVSAPRVEVRPAPRPAPRPDVRVDRVPEITRSPRVAPRTATRTRTKPQTGVWTGRVAMFGGLFMVTWCVSSMMGQVMTASAFRDGKHAHSRAESARRALSELRKRVDILTSDESAEMWAASHDMVDPALDRTATTAIHEKTKLVALNP